MKWRYKLFTLLLNAIFMLNIATAAFAGDFINMSVNSTSFVPGEQGRYTLSFKLDNPMDMSVCAYMLVYFPQGFSIVQNPIDSEDPGCALASIQYMLLGDKYYSIIQANDKTDPDQANRVTVKEDDGSTLFGFEIRNGSNINIAEETDINLIIPGVINKPDTGNGTVTLAVYSADGQQYEDSLDIILGDPPVGVPGGLSVAAEGSSTVEAAWDAVEGASRYQLFYSSEPDGCYIQACDFGKEPAPGQDWSLTDTSVSYSGTGNGGLQPGKCYYFKVRAGNEFGYGQMSGYVEVEMPSVKLVESIPADNTTRVSVGSTISATLNTPLLISDDEKIQIYEASSGTPVVKNNVEADGDTLKIDASLDYGKKYFVVLYEHAVESTDNNNIYNGLVGWSFTTRSKGGGDGYTGGSNKTTPLPDSAVAEEINKEALVNKDEQIVGETVTFSDINSHWAQKEIEQLANKGYIKGVGANMFAPERMVTRAEFTAMLINIVGAERADSCPFKDVPEKSWFRDSVSKAYASGLVKGVSGDRFNPDGYVTREQAAVMAIKALQNKKGPLTANISALDSYKDKSSVSSWAMESCALAVEKGILMGDNGYILPGENATRAQAAVILFKLQELIN